VFPTFSNILKLTLEKELQIRAWCDKCRRYRQLATRTTLHGIPPVLALNAGLEKNLESKQLWAVPGWLPEEIGIHVEGGKVTCFEGDSLRNLQRTRHQHSVTVYQLVGLVADINSGELEKPHLVSLIDSQYILELIIWRWRLVNRW
jgi:PAB-dependent poly(A)-specific ribonuclease subunit 2